MSEIPRKPYRNIYVQALPDEWLLAKASVRACYAEGFYGRHILEYPCYPIKVVRWDGGIELEHPGNGTPGVNYCT